MTKFQRALRFTEQWEGGFVDHPNDPGGATNRGITQAVYDAWRRMRGRGLQPVLEITNNKAAAIYREQYWDAGGCEALAWPLCLVHFDTAVNLGVNRAGRMLLECQNDPDRYLRLRRAYYRALASMRPKLRVFLQGWLNRVDDLEQEVRRDV